MFTLFFWAKKFFQIWAPPKNEFSKSPFWKLWTFFCKVVKTIVKIDVSHSCQLSKNKNMFTLFSRRVSWPFGTVECDKIGWQLAKTEFFSKKRTIRLSTNSSPKRWGLHHWKVKGKDLRQNSPSLLNTLCYAAKVQHARRYCGRINCHPTGSHIPLILVPEGRIVFTTQGMHGLS